MRFTIFLSALLLTCFVFAQDADYAAFTYPDAAYAAPKQIDTSRYTQDYIDDVGGKLSVGIAFGDGFGVPVRYYYTPKDIIEAGFYVGATAVVYDQGNDDFDVYLPSGPMVGFAYTRLGEKFEKAKRRKSKIRALGVTPRLYHQFRSGTANTFSQTRLSLGFTQETYKGRNHRRNYVFEIGPYYRIMNGRYEGLDFTGTDYGLYLRFNWNWFLE